MDDLIYRLRYPAYSWTEAFGSNLDKEETIADLSEAADEIERLRAGDAQQPWPSREVVAREIRRAMLDNPTDDSFNKRAEKREAIANEAADAILARFALCSVTSTEHRHVPACDCGFSSDVCETNNCHRKQIASAGLSPVPAGYSKLPDGVVCKCFKMWRATDGSHWCCLPRTVVPSKLHREVGK